MRARYSGWLDGRFRFGQGGFRVGRVDQGARAVAQYVPLHPAVVLDLFPRGHPVPRNVGVPGLDETPVLGLVAQGRLEDDEHRAEVDESTRRALKAQFVLDAVVEAEEVEVGQPELVEYLLMQAQQYGMDPNTFAQALDQQGQVESMVSEVARRKALAAALDKAKIVDAAGRVEKFNQRYGKK